MKDLKFSGADIAVFVSSLVISGAVGIWYALRGKKGHQDANEYFRGGQNMPILPTTLSIMASLVSGILILSYPAEIYSMGTAIVWTVVGQQLALLCTSIFFVPVIYRSVTSVSFYEYFEKRFQSKAIRLYTSILYAISFLIYMSVVLYAPSIALSGITNLPTWVLVLSVGLVCTIYTSIGGVKAVIWTDTIQAFIMYAGLITISVKGSLAVGGVKNVWEIAKNGSRLDGLTNIDPNPFQYMTVWTSLFGGFFFWLGGFAANQTTLQRYCSMHTQTQARMVPLISIPFMLVINCLAFFMGLIIYSYYRNCDPQSMDMIKSKDQLVIYFMFELLGSIPGLPGLFLACLFSGTLSTVSSGINSLSAVALEEFIRPVWKNYDKSERVTNILCKCLGVLFGLIAIGLAFASGPLGGIFRAVNTALGAITGPTTGITMLGIFFPPGNKIGGMVGMFVGTVLSGWLFLGAAIYRPAVTPLEVSTDGCYEDTNVTFVSSSYFNISSSISNPTISSSSLFHNMTTENPHVQMLSTWRKLYALSYFMYAVVGSLVTFFVGIVVSLATGGNSEVRKTPHLYFGGGQPPKEGRGEYAQVTQFDEQHNGSYKDYPDEGFL